MQKALYLAENKRRGQKNRNFRSFSQVYRARKLSTHEIHEQTPSLFSFLLLNSIHVAKFPLG